MILNVLDLHQRDFSEHFPISYFGNFSDQKLMDAGTPFAKAFSFNHFQWWEYPERKDACHDPAGQKTRLYEDKSTPELKRPA